MFKKHLISLVLIWLFLLLGCVGLLYHSSSDAHMAYQDLINYSDQMKKERVQAQAHQTSQTRQQVSKQILYNKGNDRLQTRLMSAESDLIYSKQEGELIERFKGMTCIMQDKLIDNSNSEESSSSLKEDESQIRQQPVALGVNQKTTQQMIRQLKTNEAVYSYKSGKLEAKEVEIAHYLLPQHLYPDSLEGSNLLFQGRAQSLQLSLFREPNLQAQGFEANFHDWENGW